jgi:hypothetical protein
MGKKSLAQSIPSGQPCDTMSLLKTKGEREKQDIETVIKKRWKRVAIVKK